MSARYTHLIVIGIIALSFAIGAYFYPQMPERVASHWNIRGQVDGSIGKTWGLFLMPAISAGLYLMFIWMRRLDSLKSDGSFQHHFNGLIVLIFSFLLYIYLLTIAWNVGIRFDMRQLFSPAFAILFYGIGGLLPYTKQNHFIGIRTPWTLKSETVWGKTHRQGAAVFKLSGLIALLGIARPDYALLFLLGPVVIGVVYLIIYSYLEYQKENC